MFDSQELTFIAICIYFFILIALSLFVFFIKRASVFEPVSLFLFFVTLFAIPLPLRYCITLEIEGNVSPLLLHFAPHLPYAVVLTGVSLVFFVAAYYSQLTNALAKKIPLLEDRGIRGTGLGIIFLLALSAVLIYLLTESLGGILPFLLLGYKSTEETFGKGYLAVGFPWIVVATLAIVERYANTKAKSDLMFALALSFICVAVFAITGNRAMIMYFCIGLVILVNFKIKSISLSTFIPIAVTGFLLLNVMGTLRSSEYQNMSDFIEKSFLPSQERSDITFENFIYTLTIGEFVVPFETLPQLIRTIGTSETPWFGLSFARAPIYLVPSFLFQDRPAALANWYMANYYGGSALNEGRQFFFLAEGYLNFGAVGVFLVAYVWGLFWGALHRWMVRGAAVFGTVLIYALLCAFMFRSIAGELTTLIVGTTQQSLAAAFIILIISRIFSRKKPALSTS